MATRNRRLRILLALAAVLGVLVLVSRYAGRDASAPQVVEAVVPASRASAAKLQAAPSAAGATGPLTGGGKLSAPVLGDRSRAIPRSDGQAFTVARRAPPPAAAPQPPSAPPAPPPVPVVRAPPLPFTFAGMVEKGAGEPRAFLTRGDALLVVARGDRIENNTYQVESLSSTSIVLTHLPTNTQQTIPLSGGTP